MWNLINNLRLHWIASGGPRWPLAYTEWTLTWSENFWWPVFCCVILPPNLRKIFTYYNTKGIRSLGKLHRKHFTQSRTCYSSYHRNTKRPQLFTKKVDHLEEMHKLLETYNLPTFLSHEGTENLNRPITNNEIDSGIRTSQQRKAKEQMASLANSTTHLKSNFNPSLKLFQNIEEEGTLPDSLYEASITLISKPDKDTTGIKEPQANIPDGCKCKNPQQNTTNQTQMHTRRITHHKQVGFISGMEGWFSIHN